MKRGFHIASNGALAVGLALVAFAILASFTRQMSWVKLVLFWIGAGVVALFLLYRIFARVHTFRGSATVSRYKTSYRIISALILTAGLAGAALLTRNTLQAWEQPAAFWEFLGESAATPNRYQGRWLLGNQRYQQALLLHEIRLLELGSVALHENGGAVEISCQIDSQPLSAATEGPASLLRFKLPPDFEIPPLGTKTVQLEVKFRHRFAIYEVTAIYQTSPDPNGGGNKKTTAKTAALGQYLLVESPHAQRLDFEQLAQLAQRPSWHTSETVIYALGRSRHPQAWQALQDLLRVNDPRVQGAVCQAMTYLGDPRATAALKQLVKSKKNPQAVRALATIATPEGVDFLLKLVEDAREESYLRVTAANMIGEKGLRIAVPVLARLVKDSSAKADFAVKREALSALARLDKSLATQMAVEAVQSFPEARQIRVCLENLAELEHQKVLPLLAEWLGNWRRYDLDADDVQTMLSYVVAGGHRDMVEVIIAALLHEPTAEMQFMYVTALTGLAGTDFGDIALPEIGRAAQTANRRLINAWTRWWDRARNEAIYAEQVSPAPAGNKI